jgi:hypothetical protein
MATQYLMQAVSDDDGALYTWLAASADFAGSGFPGPGSPVHVAVAESTGDSEGDTEDLSTTLAAGNETDGTDLEVTFLDKLVFDHPTPANVIEITHDDGLSIEVDAGGRTVFETGTGGSWVSLAGATANSRYALATSGFSLRGLYRYDPVANKVILEAVNGATGQMSGTWESPTFANLDAAAGNASLRVAPELSGAVTSLATANNVNVDLTLSTNGYYTFTIFVLLTRASTGDRRRVALTVDAERVSGTLTIVGDPTAIPGGVDTGVTVTASANSGNLRVNVANDTGETVNGRVLASPLLQDIPA